MSNPQYAEHEVAVVLLQHGERFLLCYNEPWGAFTLPMTKRRSRQDPNVPPAHEEEDWEDAAVRAAAECLGRTLVETPRFLLDVPEYQSSDRTGEWKRYHFRVFHLSLKQEESRPDLTAEWLTAGEIGDSRRRPVSKSARDVLAELGGKGLLP